MKRDITTGYKEFSRRRMGCSWLQNETCGFTADDTRQQNAKEEKQAAQGTT